MAWAMVPWQSPQGQEFRLPLCFTHVLRFINEQEKARQR
jgi:hypothetical protein